MSARSRQAPAPQPKPKREQVAAACERCRRTKTKCSGTRPCRTCNRVEEECIFVTENNETRQLALKRRFEDLSEEHDDAQKLLAVLAGEDERLAKDAFCRLRAGHAPRRIIQSIQGHALQRPAVALYERHVCQEYLIALLQSTAPLQDIVRAATRVLEPGTRLAMPSAPNLLPLKNYVITLESIGGDLTLARAKRNRQLVLPGLSPAPNVPHEGDDRPLLWVPASPWTTITGNSQVTSQLVSTFFTAVNPYWRFVEEETFIRSMRLKDVDDPYCSPLLVNSVLACASLFSEADGAFAEQSDLLTRGEQYHNEAMRLRTSEASSDSVASLQALQILAIESCWRGLDRLGWKLAESACAMNEILAIPKVWSGSNSATIEYARVRTCIACTVNWIQTAFAHATLRRPESLGDIAIDSSAPRDLLPDVAVNWIWYPYSQAAVPIRLNHLMQERQSLMNFMLQATQLFPCIPTNSADLDTHATAEAFAERLESWRRTLPVPLSYTPGMAPALFEFHGQVRVVQMTLYDQWIQAILASVHLIHPSRLAIESLKERMLELTHITASSLRDYRESYGSKGIPAILYQQATVAAFIVLREPGSSSVAPHPTPASSQRQSLTDKNARTLEECLRCLLACGVQAVQPRGIARMVYQTAVQLESQLPESVEQMLHIISETAWQPSDVRRFDSMYPNFVFASKSGANPEDYEMDSMLRQWEDVQL